MDKNQSQFTQIQYIYIAGVNGTGPQGLAILTLQTASDSLSLRQPQTGTAAMCIMTISRMFLNIGRDSGLISVGKAIMGDTATKYQLTVRGADGTDTGVTGPPQCSGLPLSHSAFPETEDHHGSRVGSLGRSQNKNSEVIFTRDSNLKGKVADRITGLCPAEKFWIENCCHLQEEKSETGQVENSRV